MKKLILLFSVGLVAFMANGQVFTEYFENAPINGNLEGYNNWYVCLKSSDANGVSPKIAEGALFYDNYAGTNIGNVAVLDSVQGSTSATQRISTKIVKFGNDTLKAVAGEKIYTAFLANISSHSYRSYRDFFTYEGSKTSSMTRGRVFAKINTDGTLSIAVTKNSSTSTDYVESTSIPGLTLSPDLNHLFVLVYETIATGTSDDKITLYIDPDLTKSESDQSNVLVAKDTQTDYSANSGLGINLRQRGISAQIGGIRVGKSWDAVLLNKTGVKNPSVDNNIWTNGKNILTQQKGMLKVYNLSGAELISAQTEGSLATTLAKGVYLVRFNGNDGSTNASKILIQ